MFDLRVVNLLDESTEVGGVNFWCQICRFVAAKRSDEDDEREIEVKYGCLLFWAESKEIGIKLV